MNCTLTWKASKEACKTVQASLFEKPKTNTNEILEMGELNYLKNTLVLNYKNFQIGRQKLDKLRTLVATCNERSIDLKVFICPVRALYWEFYYQNNLWKHVEQWKRELAAIYPVWDFSGFTPLTTETLETQDCPLYIECSHFTPEAGNMLLKQMYQGPENTSIGVLLTPENVEPHLAKILQDRQEWLQGKGKDINVKFIDKPERENE